MLMTYFRSLLAQLVRDEKGQTAVEYGLVLALVALVIVVASGRWRPPDRHQTTIIVKHHRRKLSPVPATPSRLARPAGETASLIGPSCPPVVTSFRLHAHL